ncbi:MAG: carboxypeptidase regulatory-like domain-containing protein, partial [Acidobacteriia bacterium]|nr:carboxypeptidase regulatory-like domain-containing protein [Terriglobia bacterium]
MTPVRQMLLLVICIGSLSAQTNAHKGRIIGVVLDPAGASVAEAQVTLVNDTTGVVRALRSS